MNLIEALKSGRRIRNLECWKDWFSPGGGIHFGAAQILSDNWEVEPEPCKHRDTMIWEPHLAGARKCKGCGMVYNPNKNPAWHIEIEPIVFECEWSGKGVIHPIFECVESLRLLKPAIGKRTRVTIEVIE